MTGQRGFVAGLLLATFAIAFEVIGIATALPTIMAHFRADHLYPWAFTTVVTGMLVTAVIAGRVADRRGPAIAFAVGFVAFLLGLVLGAAAPNVWLLLAARVLQGIGGGALNLALGVVIALGFDAAARPKIMALLSFCWVLPAFLGPPIAAWLTAINWRWVFLAMLPMAAVAAVISLPEIRRVQAAFVPGDDAGERVPGWPLLALAMAPSLILLAGQEGFGGWRLGFAAAGVTALLWSLPRVLAPATYGLRPGISSVVATRAMQAGSFFAAEAILLVVLQNLRGLSPGVVGLALTVGSVGWSTGSWLQSRPLLPRGTFIRLGALLNVVGLASLTLFAWVPWVPVWLGLIGWVVAGLGMGLTMTSTAVAVMSLSSEFEQGRNQSSMQVAEAVGNALFTALSGGLYTALLAAEPKKLSFTAALGILVCVAVAAVLSSNRIGPVSDPPASSG